MTLINTNFGNNYPATSRLTQSSVRNATGSNENNTNTNTDTTMTEVYEVCVPSASVATPSGTSGITEPGSSNKPVNPDKNSDKDSLKEKMNNLVEDVSDALKGLDDKSGVDVKKYGSNGVEVGYYGKNGRYVGVWGTKNSVGFVIKRAF